MGCGQSSEKDKVSDKKLPEDFPADIEADYPDFVNWAQDTFALDVLTAYPKSEEEVVKLVNWAVKKNFKVRPIGVKHNWSPITIVDQGRKKLDNVLLVSLKHMTKVTVTPAKGDAPAHAVVQLGIGQLEFLTALEKAEGGNGKIGFGLVHTPAPDSITVGGMLAIDGHGTSIPVDSEAPFIDRKTANYGTYSNLMLACRAVVWDDETSAYVVKEFRRERGQEIAPFLTHVGRAFLTEATLQVEPNYYMRCVSRLDIDWKKMFPETVDPANPQEQSMMWFIKQHGRAEAIWFPFTDTPWLKYWQVTDDKLPEGSTEVKEACNYPFSDQLGDNLTNIYRHMTGSFNENNDKLLKEIHAEEKEKANAERVKAKKYGPIIADWFQSVGDEIASAGASVVGGPGATPFIAKMTHLRVCTGLVTNDADDIWGPSKNTLIYVRDTTLRVTANGYTVMTNVNNVQQCMHVFAHMYRGLLEKYAKEDKYPISCPLEIRVTGLDDPTPIGGAGLETFSPPLSAMHLDEEAKANGWNVALWLDVLSLPGAPTSNDFYAEMEEMLLAHETFNGKNGRIRPEWSKGWGYTKEGPWKSQKFLDHTRQAMPRWNEMMAELRRHDRKNLYSNPWMDAFFTDVAAPGAVAAVPAAVVAPSDRLEKGAQLKKDQELRSQNGAYRLIMQGDGNLVLYEGDKPLWASNTDGKAATHAALDETGELTVFNDTERVWSCGAKGTFVLVQNDRNFVLYAESGATWATGTEIKAEAAPEAAPAPAPAAEPAPVAAAPAPLSDRLEKDGQLKKDAELRSQNGTYRLLMQGDGNLVLYEGDKPLWASNTDGKAATHAALDETGELTVFNDKERVWSCGAKGTFVLVQNDRNLVLYAESGATWATGTEIKAEPAAEAAPAA